MCCQLFYIQYDYNNVQIRLNDDSNGHSSTVATGLAIELEVANWLWSGLVVCNVLTLLFSNFIIIIHTYHV